MIMGLDVGSKRIGIAVSDPSGSFALPVATLERANRRADLAVKAYLDEYGVAELVVGDPLTLAGERGLAARGIDESSLSCVRSLRVRSIAWTSG